jgi:hypothetical protein
MDHKPFVAPPHDAPTEAGRSLVTVRLDLPENTFAELTDLQRRMSNEVGRNVALELLLLALLRVGLDERSARAG